MKYTLAIIFTIILHFAQAQVSEIKEKSSSNKSTGGNDHNNSSGSSNAGFAYFLFRIVGYGFVEWQQYKLTKREENPTLVSLEVMLQGAAQPSAYYLATPRIRGNWGLFSTDFRFNYLVEQDIDGTKDLSTLDWQILQLNVITTRNVVLRIGGGVLQENFGDKHSFFESTYGLTLRNNNRKFVGNLEYRFSRDYDTEVVTRMEFSANAERQIFSTGILHGNVSLGGVYQRYYESVNVWGIQAGLVIRLY